MWQLKKENKVPVYRSIVELIMTYIQQGELLPGEKIPAERKLAHSFQVNRSTVVHALDELVSMGLLIRKQGSGTVVNDGKWGVYTGASVNWHEYLSQAHFSQTLTYEEHLQQALQKQTVHSIDAYTGELPLALVPAIELPNHSWKDFLREEQHQDEFGYQPLKQEISRQLKKSMEFELDTKEILITSGAQQALFLVVQTLLKAGDAVAIEEPSFLYSLSIFQAAGIRLYGIPLDEAGMQVSLLEREIVRHKIKMVLVNPTYQNPTGTVMSLNRRKELIKLCQKYQIPIVEDDVFDQLSFPKTTILPSLKKLAPETVLSIGSLSKVLGSTTKIGWLCAPVAVLKKIAAARKEMDMSVSIFPQVLASYAWKDAHYDQKINELRKELAQRATFFQQALAKYAPGDFTFNKPIGGYYIWLQSTLINLRKKEMEQLVEEQIFVAPDLLFGNHGSSIRVNFARLTKEESQILAQKLHYISQKWRKNRKEKQK